MDVDSEPLEVQIANLPFLETLYSDYQNRSREITPAWKSYFEELESKETKQMTKEFVPSSEEEKMRGLFEAYRRHGHLLATINPISLVEPVEPDSLHLEKLGFKENQKEALFPTLGLLPQSQASLNEIVTTLKSLYSNTVGFEFKGFVDPILEDWMQSKIESGIFQKPFNSEEKLFILNALTQAEVLESFLQTKHVGKKRFSLEGAESLIPLLALLTNQAAEEGVEEIFIGMSHRGRLNVLANILNKPIPLILNDFDDDYIPSTFEGMGDIRYHKGHANEAVQTYHGNKIKLTMAPNPSHLESVNPVVEGQTHAKQFLIGDTVERSRIMPLLLHGDAALSGQGIVYETLQMNKLPGFETGGTLHIVINNQIGFTTSPEEGRSTLYCTDIARTFGAPVFHVNSEDPEMCVRVALFAFEIRQRFHCDVFIDFNCWRKYGHNEGDEPAFTQPLEYQLIRKKKSIRNQYLDQLLKEGSFDKKAIDEKEQKIKDSFQEAFQLTQQQDKRAISKTKSEENSFSFQPVETKVNLKLLKEIADSFSKIPDNFHVHPKLENLIHERNRAIQEDKPIDWGLAEFLAYGTLVQEGTPVRIAGQDSGRGTFSHRHALWVDQTNNQSYYPLAHDREGQGQFEILNTCLSEAAALGFEYGYSTVCKKGLTIWEAQFGDFVNSAQVIIDQYLSSGEEKWGQTSNLVLLLPHGFEGQGPEHSSARMERFLALAGHDNMQIVYPSTPAQLFHLLRRQMKQQFQKPLIIFTPKGLLRHPLCISSVHDITEGKFENILDDQYKPKKAAKLVLCTGRIYYDLQAQREKQNQKDLAIVRIEQLYPLDIDRLKNIIASDDQIKNCLWVQEEPENMGAWSYISFHLKNLLPNEIPLTYVGRERSASPATGFYMRHKQELANILHQVFKA